MLTADLVRARSRSGYIHPQYLDVATAPNRQLAEQLIGVFQAAVGEPRSILKAELQAVLGTGTAFLLHRGLAKLLEDRCTFETESQIEPEELRRAVFEAAAKAYAGASVHEGQAGEARWELDRQEVLANASRRVGLGPEDIEKSLYADLKAEQILTEWKPCRPGWLLDRYNVALAQAVLLRATDLEIRLGPQSPARLRALLRKIKFFQLLHTIERDGLAGWKISLDGPLSLFKSSGRYGVKMASFLPTLLHFERWSLEASVLWGKSRQERKFRLMPKQGLRPAGQLTGQWRPEEMDWLQERFEKLDSDWAIQGDGDLVDLGGQGVLVPDYTFLHQPTGFTAVLEILGFWRRGAVASRLEQLRKHGPPNLILAVSQRLAVGEEEALGDLPGEVYLFRKQPIAKQVLAVLERLRAG